MEVFESFQPKKRKLIEGGSTGQHSSNVVPPAKKFAPFFSKVSQPSVQKKSEDIANDPLLSFLLSATDHNAAGISSRKPSGMESSASKNSKSISFDDPQFLQSQAIWSRMRIEATFDIDALSSLETSEKYRDVLRDMKVWKFPPSKPSFPREVAEKAKAGFNPLDATANMGKSKDNMVATTTAPKSFEDDLDNDPHSSFKAFLTKWQTVLYFAWDKLVEGSLASFYVMGESSQDTSSSMIHHRNQVFTSLSFYRCGEKAADLRCIVIGANQSFLKRALSLGATFYSIDPIDAISKANRMSMSNLGSYQQGRAGKSLYVQGKAVNVVLHCLVEEAFANFSNLSQQRKYQLPVVISEDYLPFAIEQSIAVQPIAFDDTQPLESSDGSPPLQDLSDSIAAVFQRPASSVGQSSQSTKNATSEPSTSSFAVLGKGANIVRITGYLTPKIVMAVSKFLTQLASDSEAHRKHSQSDGFSFLNPRNKPSIADAKSTKSSAVLPGDVSFSAKHSHAASRLTKSLAGLLNPMMISKSIKKPKDDNLTSVKQDKKPIVEEEKGPEFFIRLDAPITRMIPFMISCDLDNVDATPLVASQVKKDNRQQFVKEIRGLQVIRQISWSKPKRTSSVRAAQSCSLSLEARPSLQLNPLVVLSDLKVHHDENQKEEAIVLEPLKPYEIYVDNRMF